jgi:hypothetical protein
VYRQRALKLNVNELTLEAADFRSLLLSSNMKVSMSILFESRGALNKKQVLGGSP